MTAGISIFCDGHMHGRPCGGALHTRAITAAEARRDEGYPTGWTREPGVGDLCPSLSHDEDRP